jgi:hypothetical protein
LTNGSGHFWVHYIVRTRSRWPRGLKKLDCWDCGFEPRWGHGCWSLVFVVWCVSMSLYDELITRWQESYRVCVCVCARARASNRAWSRNLNNEAAYSRVENYPHRNKHLASKRKEPLRGRPTAVASEHGDFMRKWDIKSYCRNLCISVTLYKQLLSVTDFERNS